MVRTRVGYTGGKKPNPTYRSLGDHTESLQIDYDPAQISYQRLLDIFWRSHNPTRGVWSPQYKAALFAHGAGQTRLAEATKAQLAAEKAGQGFRRQIQTEILPLETFYRAEDYHQKYLLQRRPRLWSEVREIYRAAVDWIDSTAVARLNGYVGGYASMAQLEEEIDSLGLSQAGQVALRKIVRRFGK